MSAERGDEAPAEEGRAVADLTYTDASRELDGIVELLEKSDVDVDQLVVRLERATAIVDELDRRIRRTRAQVEELVPKLEAAARGEAHDHGGDDHDLVADDADGAGPSDS